MATEAQLAANRRNAQKSTGPRTDAGKSASKMNALQHGIDARSIVLPGENPEQLEELARHYRERYDPRNAEEDFLVETLARAEWNRRRYARIQAELTARLLDQAEPADRSLAAFFLLDTPGARALHRVIRRYEASEAAWFRAHRALERIINREEEQNERARKAREARDSDPDDDSWPVEDEEDGTTILYPPPNSRNEPKSGRRPDHDPRL